MKVTLFIATSLDGHIAGPDDDLSWLFTDADYGFEEFYGTVDSLVMGRGTYDVVKSFGKWPYPGKRTYVVSRDKDIKIETEATEAWHGDLPGLVAHFEEKGCDHVWLVGGGELVTSFLKAKLIDRMVVSLHPILLGHGIPLFPKDFPAEMLDLEDVEAFESGLVKLTYAFDKED